MSYLLEVLGRGLLAELAGAFHELLSDNDKIATRELEHAVNCEPYNIDHHRRLALRSLRDRQYARARASFDEVIKLEPTDKAARVGLACIYDDLGLTRKALENLTLLADEAASDEAVAFAIGFLQERLGESALAAKSYKTALELNENLRNAHERLAAVYLKLGDTPAAIEHYEHLNWCQPGDIHTAITLGNLYLRAGRFEDAVRSFEHAIVVDPDNWEAKDDYVSACMQAEKHDEALVALREMIERRPECADQYLRLGDVYTKLGMPPQALQAYTQAVTLHPDYLEATIKIGTTHLRDGAYSAAAKAFARAVEINDRIMTAFVGLGVAQLALDKVDDAKVSLEMAAGAEPNSTLMFREMARLQLKVSASQQAARYTSPAEVVRNPDAPPSDNVDDILEYQIKQLGQALTLHPNHADLHYRLGLLQRSAGRIHEAIECFQKAVAINPRYMKALMKLAIALREVGRLDEAIAAATQALEVDTESIDLHYQLGLIFADRRQFAHALEHFDRAVANDPTNLDYTANLALALQNMGLLDRAAEAWRTLCEVSEESGTPVAHTGYKSRFAQVELPSTEPPA